MPEILGHKPDTAIHTMTDADRTALALELKRTNAKPHTLAREVTLRTARDLTTRKLRTLLTGTNSQLPSDQWQLMLNILAELPDNNCLTRVPSERISVTGAMREEFKAGLERTNLTLSQLAMALRPQISDVTTTKLSKIGTGRLRSIDPGFWDAIVKRLKS